MNKCPLVSIIIPVYNVEKYIEKCCRSVFEQTYANCEWVFVDDCGTDDSMNVVYSLIEEYGRLKNQIKVICHDVNKGVAVARRTGSENAKGEYVLYVDSDDCVKNTMVERLVIIAEDNDADVVVCNYVSKGKAMSYSNMSAMPKDHLECMALALQGTEFYSFLWNKLIKRSLIVDNAIYAPSGLNYREDLDVAYKLFFFAKTVVLTYEVLYYYRDTEDGASNKWFKGKLHIDTSVMLIQVKELNDFVKQHCITAKHVLDSVDEYSALIMKDIILYGDCRILEKNRKLFSNVTIGYVFKLLKRKWPVGLCCLLYKTHMLMLLPIARYFRSHGLYRKG